MTVVAEKYITFLERLLLMQVQCRKLLVGENEFWALNSRQMRSPSCYYVVIASYSTKSLQLKSNADEYEVLSVMVKEDLG